MWMRLAPGCLSSEFSGQFLATFFVFFVPCGENKTTKAQRTQSKEELSLMIG
jgi:hypothetical protein